MSSGKKVIIAIRVTRRTREDFKRISLEFGSYEKAIEAFIQVFKQDPGLFPTKYPLPRPLR